jgi:hypothetical protein
VKDKDKEKKEKKEKVRKREHTVFPVLPFLRWSRQGNLRIVGK